MSICSYMWLYVIVHDYIRKTYVCKQHYGACLKIWVGTGKPLVESVETPAVFQPKYQLFYDRKL